MSDGSVAIGNNASTMYEGATAVGKEAKQLAGAQQQLV